MEEVMSRIDVVPDGKRFKILVNFILRHTYSSPALANKEAEKIHHKIIALAVCSNHVHLVAKPCGQSIEQIVSRYKNIAMFALRKNDRASSRIWTRGFDKRFCFTEQDLETRTNYVNSHKK